MHANMFSIQMLHYFSQITLKVCILVLFIIIINIIIGMLPHIKAKIIKVTKKKEEIYPVSMMLECNLKLFSSSTTKDFNSSF